MSRFDIECKFTCPYCHQDFVMGQDGIYTDDVEDETFSQCPSCKKYYQLRCVSVEVEMECLPVSQADVDPSKCY